MENPARVAQEIAVIADIAVIGAIASCFSVLLWASDDGDDAR